jgi:hypothetical protein
MQQLVTFSISALYFLLVLGASTFLLIRGIAHLFVGLFACGAFLHLIQVLGFAFLNQAPGGLSANSHYFPILALIAALGTIMFAAAFVSLTLFLLRHKTP